MSPADILVLAFNVDGNRLFRDCQISKEQRIGRIYGYAY